VNRKIVDILGEKYTITYKTSERDTRLSTTYGYCDYGTKSIVINKDFGLRLQKITIRHEFIHAFLFESGLSASTLMYEGGWATNEEMVDFFASQWVKLNKIFEKLEVL